MPTQFTQWSTITALGKIPATSGVPANHVDRISAYQKYEEVYWNDPRQFQLRVLDGESPVYVPNAEIVCNVTSHYLLKDLNLRVENGGEQKLLDQFLAREKFYSRFEVAKLAGVVRGDFVFHLRATPQKSAGTRLSLTEVLPHMVFPTWDDEDPDKLVACDLVTDYVNDDPNDTEKYVRKLSYELDEDSNNGIKRVFRRESIFRASTPWYDENPELVRDVIPPGYLPDEITSIPVYWFKNREWSGWEFGTSEIKSLEGLMKAISQQDTDVQGALSLEGLGVYATDGGRPIDQNNNEIDWVISPGSVIELTPGAGFKRVQGVTSINPAMDQIKYLEEKIQHSAGLSDIALGRVDVQLAESGIALAISFLPTLAKIAPRDRAMVDTLTHLFYDWKQWYKAYERVEVKSDIVPTLGDKLPLNKVAKLNELNNMFDREIISAEYYREEASKLGYVFPKGISDQILKEQKEKLKLQSLISKENGDMMRETSIQVDSTLPQVNDSNNKDKVNESNGTEATD